jgi:hypothetical protein
MTTVVPRLFGEPSSSYVVENGALVAKRNKLRKRNGRRKEVISGTAVVLRVMRR